MIIILTQCFPSRIGGIESFVENLSLELSKNSQVLVLADQHNKIKDSLYDKGVKKNLIIKRFGGIKFLRKRLKLYHLKKILISNKIKCVIGDSWKSFELTIDLINKESIPTICLAHGNELIAKNKSYNSRLNLTMNKISQIVCNSNFTLNLVKELDIKINKLTKIYPGAQNCMSFNEETISNINGIPILMTLARLEKRKGHEFILSAVGKLKTYYPDIKYIIAGSGYELQNLKTIVKNLDIQKNVIFVGNINNNQKNYLFKRTNLMVMPTLDESINRSIEGFGIAYLEAAFYAIPSIASNIGGTSESVVHKNTGLIISDISDLYDVLKNLLADKNKLKLLGANAKLRAENEFTWNIIGKKYLQLINNLDNKNQ
ncbi:MAG: glycosyltransferase family 4 protein [Pelagibacteraceae bacterium]|nr:glycosyltransferase family 4 protein [Pelagibacteraceae bacterium]